MEEWLIKVKNSKVENLSESRKPYDLLLNDTTEIEVKTRAGSQYDKNGKSESTVIYLRKSQINHIEKKKYKKDYLLALISLKDLGYYGQYETWKNTFNQKDNLDQLPEGLIDKIKEFAKEEMEKPDIVQKFEEKLHIIKMEGAKKLLIKQ